MSNAIVSKTAEVLLSDLREHTDPKLRTATMSLVYELAVARDTFSYDNALKRIQYASEDQGKAHMNSAALRLKELGLIHRDADNRLTLTPAFDDKFIDISADFASQDEANYQPTTQPHTWTAPRQGLQRIATGVRAEMLEHMTIDKMPRVYSALNKMQAVGYVANPVLQEISDLRKHISDENALADGNQIMAEYNEYRRMANTKQTYYFTQTLDWRGRMYYRGTLNPSNLGEFGKAAFCFAEEKPVYRKGLKALAIHYASLAGKDKMSYAKRVKWAMSEGVALADKIKGKKVAAIQYATKQSKVYMLYVAAQEFARVYRLLEAGKPAMSGFICRQDGKCNGIQHGAALSKCQTTAENVSITPMSEDDRPTDIYIEFRNALLSLTDRDEEFRGQLDRDFCKPPVMVRGYGAGKEAVRNDLISLMEARDIGNRYVVDALLGDEEGNSVFLTEIMDTLDTVVGGMGEVTNLLRKAVKPISERAGNVYWKTLDGFPVEQVGKVLVDTCYDTMHLSAPRYDHNNELCNKRWVLRNEMPESINMEASASATMKGIAPNFVHSIDGTHVRLVADDVDASILHTHDDIGTHPEDFFMVNDSIRQQFVVIHTEHDWFGSLEEYNNVSIERPVGGYDINDALSATYLFS